jgi:putative membrane protein
MKLSSLTAALVFSTAAPAFALVMSPAEYVKTAGASDLFERQSSQLVLETTMDPKVKAFATMMVDNHAKSTAEVKAASAKSGVAAAPPMLTPTQVELIAELKVLKGAERDARYLAEQKAAHSQALSVQKAYAMDGTAPALKIAAAGIVPVVEHHLSMLKTL